MDQAEKRQLENMLLREGLAGLDDPELIQQMANLVSNFPGDLSAKHRFFEDLLNQCEASNRYEMYQAMAPKLGFRAFSLAQYESSIRQRASELISQRRMRVEGEEPAPIDVKGKKFEEVLESESTAALLTLTCHKCKEKSQYLAETPVSAMVMARADGWVREKGINKEICPKCVPLVAEKGKRYAQVSIY